MTESKERPELLGELMESLAKTGLVTKQPDGSYRGEIPGYTTELTPEGEQYVIPGAEKRTTAKKPQGELFG